MKEETLADKFYREAVEGLSEEILLDGGKWYLHVLNLQEHQQVVYTAGILNWQVRNGGFHQYFFNSYGQFAELTIGNLKLIHANEAAGLLAQALEAVNPDKLTQDVFREKIVTRAMPAIVQFDKALGNPLDKLDDRYYALGDDHIPDKIDNYLNSIR